MADGSLVPGRRLPASTSKQVSRTIPLRKAAQRLTAGRRGRPPRKFPRQRYPKTIAIKPVQANFDCLQRGYAFSTADMRGMCRKNEALRKLVAPWHSLTPAVRKAIMDSARATL